MILVLDTAALWSRRLLRALADAHRVGLTRTGAVQAVLPAIALAERLRQLHGRPAPARALRDALAVAGVSVEPFGDAEAARLPPASAEDAMWQRHARDFLIAAHVTGDRVIVTPDEGPAWSGLRRWRPEQAAVAVEDLASPAEPG